MAVTRMWTNSSPITCFGPNPAPSPEFRSPPVSLDDGGSINSPLVEDRPNIGDATGTITKALLSGDISAKFNINAKNALMAGVGLRWIAPLKPGGPHDYDGDRFDADNPYVTYQYLYNWKGLQNVLTFVSTYYTNVNLANEGYVATFLLDQETVYDLGKSGFSVGFSAWVQSGYL